MSEQRGTVEPGPYNRVESPKATWVTSRLAGERRAGCYDTVGVLLPGPRPAARSGRERNKGRADRAWQDGQRLSSAILIRVVRRWSVICVNVCLINKMKVRKYYLWQWSVSGWRNPHVLSIMYYILHFNRPFHSYGLFIGIHVTRDTRYTTSVLHPIHIRIHTHTHINIHTEHLTIHNQ